MSKIEKRIRVDLTVERVFSYIPEVTDSPEIWPGLLEVGVVEHLPGGGAIAHWVYRLSGAIIADTDDPTEPLVDRRNALAMLGNIACAMRWNFQPDTRRPRISLDDDYTYWSLC